MPTYDYKCKTCNTTFEHFQSMNDAPLSKCTCGKEGEVEKMISSGSGIIFKGTGFYVNDYKKESVPKTESAAPSCSSGGCGCN